MSESLFAIAALMLLVTNVSLYKAIAAEPSPAKAEEGMQVLGAGRCMRRSPKP